jgi:Domain of unknown function (DUF4412)
MYTRLCLISPLLLSLCALAYGHPARAATLPAPRVEYSADRIVETDAGTFQGKVWSAKDRERSETTMQGMQTVMILRRDKQLGWMLMPAQKMYQQVDFTKARQQSGAAPDSEVDITQVGTESVAGFETTKYKLLMKDGSAGGFIWITPEGIAVKMDMLSKADGAKTRITMSLSNVQTGAQDPQLFEVPEGYTAMPAMGAFGVGKSKGFGGLGSALKSALTNGAVSKLTSH